MLSSFFISLFFACSNPYQEAEAQNTIEAYEKFIKENPQNSNVKLASLKLENLYLEKARESGKVEDFDIFLKKFEKRKDSENYQDAFSEKMFIVWNETQLEDSEEAYEKFIKEYGHTQDKRIKTAELLKKVAPYKKNLKMERIEKEQVDTSQSSSKDCIGKGTDLNGWLFKTTFTNETTRSIKFLRAKVLFLDEDGIVISAQSDDSTVIIGELHGRSWATPKRRKAPFNVGETREWCYITGDIPPNWSKKVKIQLIDLIFMND